MAASEAALVEAAVQIAAHLTTTFPAATVERTYLPTYDTRDLATLYLVVVPMSQTLVRLTRTHVEQNVRVDVAVMKHIDTGNTEIDSLMGTVQDVIDALLTKVFEATDFQVMVVDVQNTPALSEEHYINNNQFTSLITATCKVLR